MQNFNLAQI